MSEVKWIKLSTDIPDNKKLKRIRRMPDGNNIALFWMFLLARAGESNSKGGLFISDTIPYTVEDLSDDFNFSIEFVTFALLTLEKNKMIERYDDIIFIKNWEEYQQLDKLEEIKEKNRLRVAKHREKQKQLAIEKNNELSNGTSNVTCNVTVTGGNATDIDIDLDKELDKDNNYYNNNIKQTTFSKVEKEFGRPLSPIEIETINYWDEDYSVDMIDLALRESVLNGVYNLKYIESILSSWDKGNLKTKEAIMSHLEKRRKSKSPVIEIIEKKDIPKVPLHDWTKENADS